MAWSYTHFPTKILNNNSRISHISISPHLHLLVIFPAKPINPIQETAAFIGLHGTGASPVEFG